MKTPKYLTKGSKIALIRKLNYMTIDAISYARGGYGTYILSIYLILQF